MTRYEIKTTKLDKEQKNLREKLINLLGTLSAIRRRSIEPSLIQQTNTMFGDPLARLIMQQVRSRIAEAHTDHQQTNQDETKNQQET